MKKILKFLFNSIVFFNPKFENGYKMKQIGTKYGGYSIYENFTKDPIIISCGVGEDVTFDVEMIDRYNAKILLIDPTPRAIKYYEMLKLRFGENGSKKYNESGRIDPFIYDMSKVHDKNLLFENKAISKTNDKKMELFYPLNNEHVSLSVNKKSPDQKKFIATTVNLDNIIKKFSFEKIDILKLDVEGAELEVLEDIINKKIFPKQLLIEYDIRRNKNLKNKIILSKVHKKLLTYYKLIYINEKGDFTYLKK